MKSAGMWGPVGWAGILRVMGLGGVAWAPFAPSTRRVMAAAERVAEAIKVRRVMDFMATPV